MSFLRQQLSVRSAFALAVVIAFAAGGCGGDASPTAPNLPPTNGGGSFGSQSTSAVSGQVVGGGGGSALSSEAFAGTPAASAMGGVQVSVQGTGLTTTTNGNGRFLLVGVPNGTVVLQFAGGGTNATVTLHGVGANTLVQITVQVAQNSATVVDQLVEDLAEFSGPVDNVDGSSLSFKLENGTVIFVDDNTWWDTGGDLFTFADLAAQHAGGMLVVVEGRVAVTPEGDLLATVVKAEVEEPDVDDLDLRFSRAKWSLGWIDNGSLGQGNSAIEAYIDDGPFALIDPDSVEMEGPDGTVAPFDTRFDADRFVARFTKAQVISVATGVPPGDTTEVIVRGTVLDGTPFELVAEIEIVDDDDSDDDDDDDGGNKIDPAVAAQAIADIEVVIDYIEGLVDDGLMAANKAKPLLNKLESVIDKLEKLNGIPAINQLEAFLNQLDSSRKTGKIPEDDADFIEELVEDIIDLLESSG